MCTYTAPVRDTTADTAAAAKTKPTGRVSMTKNVRPARPVRARPVRPPVENVKPPRTIDYATAAIALMAAAGIVQALLLLGNTAILTAYVTKANEKKPVKNFDPVSAVHTLRSGSILMGIILAVALLLLAWALRRTRSASASRWAMLIIFVFTGLPFQVKPATGLPTGSQIAGVTVGIAAIAAVVLVFAPKPSQLYFRACREANTPEELRGQPRPGLGSLFGPKRPRGAEASTPAPARTAAPDRPAAAPKSKAKVRSDSDAIAKGAELARSRAKASKSRRTTD